ncbi:pyridoxal phosphate-dependent aminotransferase [Hymenobacter properus]|uniref:Aminotransferase n=1 Tax=Hymenobacter properus TaxID=2791026 RepID=A0A931BNH2_9BACT|nr:aminotransferase class I/II-fold pyridoxal phosphate-dependent enzyme [Hymenobacter properus]MBF9142660.1 aminotransferase class I/II-fold pyridoxal phosphate-dependent enzyme [Hymenobacter properus]MBR7721468.1 aminotransferase class I/II-fold pyridoxal phosphate-dependent enzyme [Microvirga sp. SRT04]
MQVSVASRLAHTGEYYFSRKLRELAALNAAGANIINLGIGSPDLPPHPSVTAALAASAAQPGAHGYQGYQGTPALRSAMAGFYQRHYGVALDPTSEILPLLGSKEGLMHVAMTFLEAGDAVLIPNPGYPTYRAVAEISGAEMREYDLTAATGWLPDLEALAATDLTRVKLMLVNYPHMPTGAAADLAFLTRLVAFARAHGILLVHDNPYGFILNETAPLSLLAVPGAHDVALELNSLSKSHNLAGWRVGMLCGRADLIAAVLRFKSNMDSGMFLPVQQAAVAALALGDDWFQELNDTYRARRALVLELLQALGCEAAAGQVGLFVWAAVPAEYADGYALSDAVLAEARVFLTPGGIFGSNGRGYVRASLCQPESVLREALARVQSAVILSAAKDLITS